MRTVKLKDASDEDLRQYARDTLGLEIHPQLGRAKVLAKISAVGIVDKDGNPSDEISLVDAVIPATEKKAFEPLKKNERTYRVIIHTQEKEGGDRPVELGCNGKWFLVPRGEEYDIPERYFESLNNAKQLHYINNKEDKGLDPHPREVHAYPFSVVRRPPPKQVQAEADAA